MNGVQTDLGNLGTITDPLWTKLTVDCRPVLIFRQDSQRSLTVIWGRATAPNHTHYVIPYRSRHCIAHGGVFFICHRGAGEEYGSVCVKARVVNGKQVDVAASRSDRSGCPGMC